VYGVLLRPLPYREAKRLVLIRAEVDYAGAHRPVPVAVQPDEIKDWQRRLDSIEAAAFFAEDVKALSGGDNGSEVLDSAIVSRTFFSTLAGPFAAGRRLDADDDDAPSAVISERLARRLFGGSALAIGRPLLLTPGCCTASRRQIPSRFFWQRSACSA
jgi:hypothetical protein